MTAVKGAAGNSGATPTRVTPASAKTASTAQVTAWAHAIAWVGTSIDMFGASNLPAKTAEPG